MTDERNEFDLIRRLFAPLAAGRSEALGLLDDAAVLSQNSDEQRVVTTDCLVAGVHFRTDDPASSVAARALRVNLSDLAAMGAVPDCYTLALAIPPACDDAWLSAFAAQLLTDQSTYQIDLVGGDTVSTPGPMAITITAFGIVPSGSAIRRSTAQVGDDVYVSGTLGDAALGLAVLTGSIAAPPDAGLLTDRFWYPSPRSTLGPALRGTASAMADVSDGLIADLAHICDASNVGANLVINDIPFSAPARSVLARSQADIAALLTGGDDYELIFTAASTSRDAIQKISDDAACNVTRIGSIHATEDDTEGRPVTVLDPSGASVPMDPKGGYEHQW